MTLLAVGWRFARVLLRPVMQPRRQSRRGMRFREPLPVTLCLQSRLPQMPQQRLFVSVTVEQKMRCVRRLIVVVMEGFGWFA